MEAIVSQLTPKHPFQDPKWYLKVLLKLWSKQKLARRAFFERIGATAMDLEFSGVSENFN